MWSSVALTPCGREGVRLRPVVQFSLTKQLVNFSHQLATILFQSSFHHYSWHPRSGDWMYFSLWKPLSAQSSCVFREQQCWRKETQKVDSVHFSWYFSWKAGATNTSCKLQGSVFSARTGETDGAVCDRNSRAVHWHEGLCSCSCSCPGKDILIFKGVFGFYFFF